MKIAIDIRALQDKRHSGVQEYLLSLLEEIFLLDQQNDYLLFSSGRKDPKNDLDKICEEFKKFKQKNL